MKPVLGVTNLTVVMSRNGRSSPVLDDVSFNVMPGEIVSLVGESGSGKSTIGMAAQGLLPALSQPVISGSIRIAGLEIVGARKADLQAARRSLVRVIPQDPLSGLDPTMTVVRQLAEQGRERRDILRWLGKTGLTDVERIADSYPHRLSGGQRQRVLIALAMMAQPRLLIADEPTTALDVTTQAQLLAMLRALASEQGTGVLLITHDLAVAASLASRIIVLRSGKVVETAPTARLIGAPSDAYTKGLLAARFDVTSDRTRPLPAAVGTSAEPWPAPLIGERTALRLEGVSKSFSHAQPVLRSVDLSVRTGECVALVGESGAGKSTILRIAMGLAAPDAGKVMRAAGGIQLVQQDPVSALTPWLTVGEQIAEPLRAQRIPAPERQARVAEALSLVGLDSALAAAIPAELSMGECQRALLARAIVVPPALLLCDEPVSAMDVSLSVAILNLIGTLRRRLGIAVLFVTHDIAAARIVADRIAVLKDGELIEQGEAATIVTSPVNPHTRALIAAVPSLGEAR